MSLPSIHQMHKKSNVVVYNYLAEVKKFLSYRSMEELSLLPDPPAIEDALSQTGYKEDIEAASSIYKPPISIDVALNRHIVKVNRLALQVVPDYGKRVLLCFLSRWDIEDILLILAAKSLGRRLEETEPFIISPRNLPVGIAGNVIPFSHMRLLMEQKDVESVIKELVRYRYGVLLLQHINEFNRSGDLGIFEAVLLNDYYSRLQWELRFRKGDEGALREYIRAEITKRNLLTIMKSRDSPIEKQILSRHLLQGGFLETQDLLAAHDSKDLSGLAGRLKQWFDIAPAIKRFNETRNIAEFEVEIDNAIVENYFWRFRMHDILSLTGIFMFILKAQYERENIRRIVYGKQYQLPVSYIKSILLES
ncbi:MAG: V-type ATPase subunit [Conexivisphaerales archaeon]